MAKRPSISDELRDELALIAAKVYTVKCILESHNDEELAGDVRQLDDALTDFAALGVTPALMGEKKARRKR